MKHLSEKLIQERLQAFSKLLVVKTRGIQSEGVAEEQTPATSEVEAASLKEAKDDALKLLIEIGSKPFRPFGLCAESCGLNAEKAGRAKAKLVDDGMVKEWKSWPKKGSGGHPTFCELGQAGAKALLAIQIEPFKPVGRGGFEHSVFMNGYLPNYFAQRDVRFALEYHTEQKCIDAVFYDSYQRMSGIEVVCTGTVQHNVSEAVRCAGLDGIYKVIVACKTKELVKGIKAALKQELMPAQQKISCSWIGYFWPWEK